MSDLFIILGAGASFDYIEPIYNIRDKSLCPPLTNDLLDTRRFGGHIEKFPEVSQLTSSILSALRMGKNFEEHLLELKEKGEHRLSQLAGLQFYLHHLFQVISDGFGDQPGNNYSELINKINDNKKNACIATFNYDILLEQNISFLKDRKNLNDYVTNRIKLIKLHGSCDWVFYLQTNWPEDVKEAGGTYKYITKYPNIVFQEKKPVLYIRRDFLEQRFSPIHNEKIIHNFYPAIAIPLPLKDIFICPDNHIQVMKENIKAAEKILIIGWKAGDKNLLQVLQENCKRNVEFTIVSGTKEGADLVASRISDIITSASFKTVGGGFTKFLGSPTCEEFFQ